MGNRVGEGLSLPRREKADIQPAGLSPGDGLARHECVVPTACEDPAGAMSATLDLEPPRMERDEEGTEVVSIIDNGLGFRKVVLLRVFGAPARHAERDGAGAARWRRE